MGKREHSVNGFDTINTCCLRVCVCICVGVSLYLFLLENPNICNIGKNYTNGKHALWLIHNKFRVYSVLPHQMFAQWYAQRANANLIRFNRKILLSRIISFKFFGVGAVYLVRKPKPKKTTENKFPESRAHGTKFESVSLFKRSNKRTERETIRLSLLLLSQT